MSNLTGSASRITLLALIGALCIGFLGVVFYRGIPQEYGKEVLTLFTVTIGNVVGYYVGKQGTTPPNSDPMGGN